MRIYFPVCQDEPECGTLRLSSLSPAPGSVAELHLALTNTFAHLFVMKMDWLLARGLPCLGLARTWSLTRLHIRSGQYIHTHSSLHILYFRKLFEGRKPTFDGHG